MPLAVMQMMHLLKYFANTNALLHLYINVASMTEAKQYAKLNHLQWMLEQP